MLAGFCTLVVSSLKILIIMYHSVSYLYVLTICYEIHAELTLNPPEGIIAGPVNEENFFEWEALIT